jgi:hypothetical protein
MSEGSSAAEQLARARLTLGQRPFTACVVADLDDVRESLASNEPTREWASLCINVAEDTDGLSLLAARSEGVPRVGGDGAVGVESKLIADARGRRGDAALVVADCAETWMLPVMLGWEETSTLRPEEHLAVLSYLEEWFGAVLSYLDNSSAQLVLQNPPPISPLAALASTICGYAGTVGLGQYTDIEDVAAYLHRSPVWTFIWD